MKHRIQIEKVQVRDGSLPPTRDAVEAAKDRNDKRAHEAGYRHAQGAPRMVERFAWVCSDGKSSNGCTYPSRESAVQAGSRHAAAVNLRLLSM